VDEGMRFYRVLDVTSDDGEEPPPPPPGPEEPVNATYHPPIAPETEGLLEWTSVSNGLYQVQFTRVFGGAPTTWENLGSIITATGPVTSVSVPVPVDEGMRFYRVVALDNP
jgi:hypothetical protein